MVVDLVPSLEDLLLSRGDAPEFHTLNTKFCYAKYSSRFHITLYRDTLKGEPQVVRMLQAKPGRSGKQGLEPNSRNLGTTF